MHSEIESTPTTRHEIIVPATDRMLLAEDSIIMEQEHEESILSEAPIEVVQEVDLSKKIIKPEVFEEQVHSEVL